MHLTERQEEILAFISDYQGDQKVPPSTRIVQKHFGFGSQTAALRHLDALSAKGVLEQVEGDAWQAKANEIQAVFELSALYMPELASEADEAGITRTCAS